MSPALNKCLAGAGLIALLTTSIAVAQTDQPIYTDSLQNGWQNWSWATVNFANTSPVHSGSDSISVSCTNYQAIYLHHPAFDSTPYSDISFWIYIPTTSTPSLTVAATTNGVALSPRYQVPSIPQNTWTLVTVPLTSLGATGQSNMDGFWIQSQSSGQIPTYYLDDMMLETNSSGPPQTNAVASITVNAAANRHAISPLIYGVAFASTAELEDLNAPINRSGGNLETRYNWQTNAYNHDADWYFESIASSPPVPGADADSFISGSVSGGAKPMITVPMIGWAPKLGPNRSTISSYSVAKYGPQTGADPYFSDAGNGISVTNNTSITWNDPDDANFPVGVSFQQGFVHHLITNWGATSKGGVPYYLMDNEVSIWFSTHRDVHPVGPTMREIFNDIVSYGGMVKSLDSNALVLGPEEWGWYGYLYSGYDQQWSGAHNDYNPADYPDRTTNGGWDYLPWLLNQLHQYQITNGTRLLDYFTLHCYPQENNVSGSATDYQTEILRNQSTRVFWDTNYVDPSWINDIIMLIPRMQNWVSNYYPGTKIGITEYNWGAEQAMNGATAQADILGIFGRQSLDLATRWTVPATNTPTYLAMKIYRNYDGNHSTFGDTSVSATGPNSDNVAMFAATRSSDAALTIMVINKNLSGITPISVSITNFISSGAAQVWQLNSNNVIARLGDATINSGTISLAVPSPSITLLVIPATPPKLIATRVPGRMSFSVSGEIGQTFVVQFSTNLTVWIPVSTNTLASTQTNLTYPISSQKGFYRAYWMQ